MRAFIAIELPLKIKEELGRMEEKLKETGADVKWVKPSNMHLTLKFLGEISQDQLNKITDILTDVLKNRNKFSIAVKGLGAFPDMTRPKVIWAGIEDKDNIITRLAAELEERLTALNILKEERNYSGHITIGRVKSWKNTKELSENISRIANDCNGGKTNFTVERITLFKSNLTPLGPVYEALKETNLTTT